MGFLDAMGDAIKAGWDIGEKLVDGIDKVTDTLVDVIDGDADFGQFVDDTLDAAVDVGKAVGKGVVAGVDVGLKGADLLIDVIDMLDDDD